VINTALSIVIKTTLYVWEHGKRPGRMARKVGEGLLERQDLDEDV